jgi:UDP-3-O-[3-hydroxymyristoyl] N-acetylglucosamine deacetylase
VDQSSIKNGIAISGIGLHTGKSVSLKFKPARENTGIVFIRTDLPGKPRVTADLENVTSTIRGTNLGEIHTVEHLLSALYALSISNIEIEMDSFEPPAMDGGARSFCDALKEAGIKKLGGKVRTVKLKEPIVVRDKDKCLIAVPSDRFAVSFMINYPVSFIGSQFHRFEFGTDDYIRDIAPARTYGFISELKELKEKGLALGADESNAIAIGDVSYLTPLRFKDELARHKILDLIGDLSLVNAKIEAHIIAIRSGHAMNIRLAKALIGTCD